jgi:hypothetical protein
MMIDPALLAEWEDPERTRLVFQPDSSVHSGTVDVPYGLEDSGNILNINNISRYTRLPGTSPTSIAGHWRDDPNGEEIIYRTDGRYLALFDGESLVYFGTYVATSTSVTSYEYRGKCTTSGNQITFNTVFGDSLTGRYAVTEDSLVLQFSGAGTAYRKVANPVLDRTAQQRRRWTPFA